MPTRPLHGHVIKRQTAEPPPLGRAPPLCFSFAFLSYCVNRPRSSSPRGQSQRGKTQEPQRLTRTRCPLSTLLARKHFASPRAGTTAHDRKPYCSMIGSSTYFPPLLSLSSLGITRIEEILIGLRKGADANLCRSPRKERMLFTHSSAGDPSRDNLGSEYSVLPRIRGCQDIRKSAPTAPLRHATCL